MSGTLLAIDAGNTRIKWGMHDGARWLKQGWVDTARAADLEAALRDLPRQLRERRAIQSGRRASTSDLARWIEPAATPWRTLGDQRRLDAILSERQSNERRETSDE